MAPTDPQWWSHPVQQARLMIFLAETMTIMAVGWTRTVHDIVNNSLNQLQSLRIDAEGHVPACRVDCHFRHHHRGNGPQARALDGMTTYVEKPMVIGIGLDDSVR